MSSDAGLEIKAPSPNPIKNIATARDSATWETWNSFIAGMAIVASIELDAVTTKAIHIRMNVVRSLLEVVQL